MRQKSLIAVVDVDDTLWDFSSKAYEIAVSEGYNIPEPKDWHSWGVFSINIPTDKLWELFDRVHEEQNACLPFPEAAAFMHWLHQHFHIIVATHRKELHLEALETWLIDYGIEYDELYLSFDKTKLFNDPRVALVIDDRPETLCAAIDKEVALPCSLRYPYNENVMHRGEHFKLFDSFADMQTYIQAVLSQEVSL